MCVKQQLKKCLSKAIACSSCVGNLNSMNQLGVPFYILII